MKKSISTTINKIHQIIKESKGITLSQIANKNHIHWDTAKAHIKALEDLDLIYKIKTDNKEKYYNK